VQMQYLRARYYDPNTGRFNQLDPFAGNNHDPQSLHKYLYTPGDPINFSDPNGQEYTLVGTASALFIISITSGTLSGTVSYMSGDSFADGFARGMISSLITSGILIAAPGFAFGATTLGSVGANLFVDWWTGKLDDQGWKLALYKATISASVSMGGGWMVSRAFPGLGANITSLNEILSSNDPKLKVIKAALSEVPQLVGKGSILGLMQAYVKIATKIIESVYTTLRDILEDRSLQIDRGASQQ